MFISVSYMAHVWCEITTSVNRKVNEGTNKHTYTQPVVQPASWCGLYVASLMSDYQACDLGCQQIYELLANFCPVPSDRSAARVFLN